MRGERDAGSGTRGVWVGGITSQHRKKSLSSDSTFGADSSNASWWWFMDLDVRAAYRWGCGEGLMD